MSSFQSIDPTFALEIIIVVACGGVVGFERQVRGKPIGIRTSILICLSTYIFVRLGGTLYGTGVDPTRVLGQVVTGVGFLGAGVILAKGGSITGVTSAAVVWMLAAIGSTIAIDRPLEAVVFAVLTVSILTGMQWLESMFTRLRRGSDEHDD